MIIYDLKCHKNHKFEGWFQDRNAFESQQKKKLIDCPVCGSSDVNMVPSSIAIMGKDAKEPIKSDRKDLSPMKMLQIANEFITKNFDDVGDRFAEVALKIHEGEEDRRNIRGTTTQDEEDILKEKGIQFFKIPIPKFDS